jgi:hypothetical protein
MARRLILDPAQGLVISRPGFDVTAANSPKLVDPNWQNLQLHAQGSSTSMQNLGGFNRREWLQVVNFPELPALPIVFVNGRLPGIDYTDYPASFPPESAYVGPGGGTAFELNYYRVETARLLIFLFTTLANTTSPVCSWQIMKNKRVT